MQSANIRGTKYTTSEGKAHQQACRQHQDPWRNLLAGIGGKGSRNKAAGKKAKDDFPVEDADGQEKGLVENFNIGPFTTVEADLKAALG